MRDTLFLLPAGFEDKGRREYCPECAEIWGLLSYYPFIRESLDVVYEPLAHPRPSLVDILGEGNWNCPTLVLAHGAPTYDSAPAGEANGRLYFDSARTIGQYYAARFGSALPRGNGA